MECAQPIRRYVMSRKITTGTMQLILVFVLIMTFNGVDVQAQSRMFIVPFDRDALNSIENYPDPYQSDMGNEPCSGDSFPYYSGHEGIDYMLDVNTPIYAAAAGTVHRYQQSCSGSLCYGYYMGIDHGNGRWTLYAHLNSYSVSDGQYVQQEDLIAYSGSSGTDVPHLHFEVLTNVTSSPVNGYPNNPYYCNNEWFTTSPPTYATGCTTVQEPVYSTTPVKEMFMVADPDSATKKFDLHAYYYENGTLKLLNRGDMGSGYANPVINDQASTTGVVKWLASDVNGDGWTDVVLISHPSTSKMQATVWFANGNGTFKSQSVFPALSFNAKLYFLSDVNADKKADLIAVFDRGNGTIEWQKCLSTGSAFSTCSVWTKDFGASTNDIFLVGDVNGNGKADVVRGYNTSDTVTKCETGGYKLRW